MADEAPSLRRAVNITELDDAKIKLTSDHHLQVEFRIDDLVRKLVPKGSTVANCGGCHGCMGCSM